MADQTFKPGDKALWKGGSYLVEVVSGQPLDGAADPRVEQSSERSAHAPVERFSQHRVTEGVAVGPLLHHLGSDRLIQIAGDEFVVALAL